MAVGLVTRTLQQMARGGIHDHVGGGFHRYAVDQEWFVPHFEKMLYDQAQIALNALEAWQASGDERHAWLARDIFDYTLRDLAHPAGGFYSAEDADSIAGLSGHSVEGAFYVWTKAEIEAALPPRDAELICAHFGVKAGGNVPAERDPFSEFTGKNILAQTRSLADTANAAGWPLQEASDRLAASLERLRAVRAARPRPHRDDKILTAWNGLMISALARAAAVPAESLADKREFYGLAAVRAAAFVRRELFDEARGILFRTWREGRGAAEGFAEDYAYLIQGLIDLYESAFDLRFGCAGRSSSRPRWTSCFGTSRAAAILTSAAGALPDLLLRLKDDYDGAEPILELGGGDESSPPRGRGRRPGERRSAPAGAPGPGRFSIPLERAPPGAAADAVRLRSGAFLEPPGRWSWRAIPPPVIFGLWLSVLNEHLGPRRSILAMDGSAASGALAADRSWLAAMPPRGGKAAAYLCENFTCQAPVTDPAELREIALLGVAECAGIS